MGLEKKTALKLFVFCFQAWRLKQSSALQVPVCKTYLFSCRWHVAMQSHWIQVRTSFFHPGPFFLSLSQPVGSLSMISFPSTIFVLCRQYFHFTTVILLLLPSYLLKYFYISYIWNTSIRRWRSCMSVNTIFWIENGIMSKPVFMKSSIFW